MEASTAFHRKCFVFCSNLSERGRAPVATTLTDNSCTGFAFRTRDQAFFYPVCLDGDGNVLTAPTAPFTCKVDGTESSESGESDTEIDQSLSPAPQPRRKVVSGVTGLLEVRMEVAEKLLDHLLHHAKVRTWIQS